MGLAMFVLVLLLAGCTLPGWNKAETEQMEESEITEAPPELDISGIIIGSWVEWSENLDDVTGYSYAFYEDGVIFVSREDVSTIVLKGTYQFIGNNTFSVVWTLPSSELSFEPMIWQLQSIKSDEASFLINGEDAFTLKRIVDEKPPINPPAPVEPPLPPQTESSEFTRY